jgi:predicted flap endonuclease-1-like 5' DNA nuclease
MTTGAEGTLMADRMERSGAFWSLVAWGAAFVAGIVVGAIVAWFGGPPAGLIFGAVAFVLVGFLVDYNFGPEPRDEAHPEPAHDPRHHHAEAAAVAQAAAPGTAVLDRAPAEVAPEAGISERVREAARAAGEAARAAFGDPGVRGGGGVPSPLMGEGVPPRPDPDPEPVPPGPVPPEPIPVPPEPAPGPIAAGAEARPAGLDAPRDGRADDLKRIKGVGPKLEDLLHRLGFWHFDQIAGWTDEEVAWVDSHLEGFNGRATRDDWVGQARILAGGGETERGEVY